MVFSLYYIHACLVVRERIGMNWCLRNKSIRHGQPNYTGYESGATEKEEVPMEPGWFLEWELTSLSGQAADILNSVSFTSFQSIFQEITGEGHLT